MKEDKDYEEKMINTNQWHAVEELDRFIDIIKRQSSKKVYSPEGNEIPGNNYWSWARNTQCKYVELRIDMRDGGFVLRDRGGNRISLEQLQWQYGQEEKDGKDSEVG